MVVSRAFGFLIAGRFDVLGGLLAAWGWNIGRLPGALRRRVRVQSVRAVPDRSIRRFMESGAMRMPRWRALFPSRGKSNGAFHPSGISPRASVSARTNIWLNEAAIFKRRKVSS